MYQSDVCVITSISHPASFIISRRGNMDADYRSPLVLFAMWQHQPLVYSMTAHFLRSSASPRILERWSSISRLAPEDKKMARNHSKLLAVPSLVLGSQYWVVYSPIWQTLTIIQKKSRRGRKEPRMRHKEDENTWQPLFRNGSNFGLVLYRLRRFQILQKSKFSKTGNFEIGSLKLPGVGFSSSHC